MLLYKNKTIIMTNIIQFSKTLLGDYLTFPVIGFPSNRNPILFNNVRCLLIVVAVIFSSCNKLVDVKAPITSTNATLVYNNNTTAIATLNNIYTLISQRGITAGITSVSLYPALSSDELDVFDGVDDQLILAYYRNSLTPINVEGAGFWTEIYSSLIFSTNATIEGLTASKELTPSIKMQLLGEAKFLRAFFYFYLVNFYGDVPLVLSTDYKLNSIIHRTPKNLVYKQIIDDLKDAQLMLSDNYLDGTLTKVSLERIVPNKSAATALLARVYLYNNDWQNAETQSSVVIDNMNLYDTVPLNDVFLVNSKESIWQLQSVSSSVTNTSEALLFILPDDGPNTSQNQFYLSQSLVNSFEINDQRIQNWTGNIFANGRIYYYPSKYKINAVGVDVSERTVLLRISEQYLIRAEARAQLGKLENAKSDLNIIRVRAGLDEINPGTKADLLDKILHERRVELFTECGHRWLDLKRLKLADSILKDYKGNNWKSTDQLYPIPQSEIEKNPSLRSEQNPGY